MLLTSVLNGLKVKIFVVVIFKVTEKFNKQSEKECRPFTILKENNVLKQNKQTCSQEQRWKARASYMKVVLVLQVDWLFENHLGYDWLKHDYRLFLNQLKVQISVYTFVFSASLLYLPRPGLLQNPYQSHWRLSLF